MENFLMDVIAENGVPFRAVFIPAGGKSSNFNLGEITKPMVEFYDRRYKHTPDGQFTGARYYVDTLMEDSGWYPGKVGGLNLHGGVSDYSLGQEEYTEILDWMETLLDRLNDEE